MYSSVKFCSKIDNKIVLYRSKTRLNKAVFLVLVFNIYLHDLPKIFSPNCNQGKINERNMSSLTYADDLKSAFDTV